MLKLLLLTVLLLTVTINSYADNDGSSNKLNSVREKITQLNKNLSNQKTDRKHLYRELKQQSKKISSANNQLADLKKQISAQKKKNQQILAQLGTNQTKQKQQLDALYKQVRQAFMNTKPSYLEMLLNQDDVASISRNSTYFYYFNKARQQQISTLADQLTQLNKNQKQALFAEQALQQLLNSQQQTKDKLAKEQQQRKITLAKLNKTIGNNSAKLSALHQEEQDLQALLDRLAKQPPPKPATPKPKITPSPSTNTTAPQAPLPKQPNLPFSRLKGKLIWPIDGKLLATYGSSRKIGSLRWQGLVIDSSKQHNVRAAAPGRVVFADWMRGFGLLIIINHGQKYMTLYGNNDNLLKRVGDRVKGGEVIATSTGQKGMHGLSGLYFELRHYGKPTNPRKWLRKHS